MSLGLGLLCLASWGFAAEPPALPVRVERRPDDCPHLALIPGQAPPAGLLDGTGKVRCSGEVIPTSQAADLLHAATYTDELRGRYRVDTATLEWKATQAERERDWIRTLLEQRTADLAAAQARADRQVSPWVLHAVALGEVALAVFLVGAADSLQEKVTE